MTRPIKNCISTTRKMRFVQNVCKFAYICSSIVLRKSASGMQWRARKKLPGILRRGTSGVNVEPFHTPFRS